MPYKSEEQRRNATKERVRRYREKRKGITKDVTSITPDVTFCLKCSELKVEIFGLKNRISDLVKERGSFINEIEFFKEKVKLLTGNKGFMSGKKKDAESDANDLPFSKKRQSGGKMSA